VGSWNARRNNGLASVGCGWLSREVKDLDRSREGDFDGGFGLRSLGSWDAAPGCWIFIIAGSRMDCLGHGADWKRACAGTGYVNGLVRQRNGFEADHMAADSKMGCHGSRVVRKRRHANAGSRTNYPGNGTIGKRTGRTLASRKDTARRWGDPETNHVDTGCAEESTRQRDGSETDQVNTGSRKD
jgi:hypothetical protein